METVKQLERQTFVNRGTTNTNKLGAKLSTNAHYVFHCYTKRSFEWFFGKVATKREVSPCQMEHTLPT